MSFSYDPSAETPLSDVRWLIADTDPVDPLQHDEEILRVLTRQPNTYRAAAFIARQIARQFARQATIDIATEVRINLSDRAKQYFDMAKDMEHQANVGAGGGGGVGVFVGGISVTQTEAAERDGDRLVPAFTRHLHDTTPERDLVPGAQGVPGPMGQTGPTGQAEGWYSGTGPPAESVGAVGDWYLDETTGEVYEKTGAGFALRGRR